MAKVRKAQAVWEGTLREGQGTVRLGEGAFEGRYSFGSRFEDGSGTNPEELLGAAHAACFSMALSGKLANAGFPPERIASTAKVHLERLDAGWTVTRIELETEVNAPGLDESTFREMAEGAKATCPISRALGPVQVDLSARLLPG